MPVMDRPVSARYRAGKIQVEMESGLEIAFPVEGNPRLEGKPAAQLDHIELSPFGLHWPELDEDLSIRGILSRPCGRCSRSAGSTSASCRPRSTRSWSRFEARSRRERER